MELTGKTESRAKVPIGTHGEVIHIYPGDWYEVLFRRPDGRTLATAAVAAENLTLVKRMKQTA